MKKFLAFLLLAGVLWACNDSKQKNDTGIQSSDTAHQHEKKQAEALTLNNGAKWKSDESTNKNVAALKAIITRFQSNQNKTLASYTAVASELQTGLDKMIKECRMQGPDHDALHHWLEPVLKNVNSLQHAANEEEAATVLNVISERVNLFTQYFE